MSHFQSASTTICKARSARACRNAGLFALLALLIFIQVAPSGGLDEQIIRVPADYETVGAALDSASDHAIVELATGLYRETLSITRPLVLRGKAGDTVVLAGSPDEPVITIADTADVRIADLVISGGKYGIFVTRSQNVTIRDNIIYDSRLAGIKVRLAAADILHNSIQAANAPYGRGIHITNTTQWAATHIIGNTVSNNAHSGIATNMTGMIYIKDNILSGNLRHGIMIDEMSHALVTDNIVDGNIETGIYVFDMSMAAICDNVVVNTAADSSDERPRYGNGILVDFHSMAEVRNNIVTDNANHGIQTLLGSHLVTSSNHLRRNGANELPRYTDVEREGDCHAP